MSPVTDTLTLYRELADRYEKTSQFSMRDRFLMLAADAAFHAGQTLEAERLRQRLLGQSKHHMMRPYNSFAEAFAAPDVQTYLNDLRANYPPEVAMQMLDSLKGTKHQNLEQTQQVERATRPSPTTPPQTSIPVTAPLLDPYGGAPTKPPFRIVDEQPRQNAPIPTTKPLGQPLPGRKIVTPIPVDPPPPPPAPPPKPAPKAAPLSTSIPLAVPPGKPVVSIPLPASSPSTPKPAPKPVPVQPEPESPTGPSWLSIVLGGLALLIGGAWVVYTIARPLMQ
jgi:hypothetical protein